MSRYLGLPPGARWVFFGVTVLIAVLVIVLT